MGPSTWLLRAEYLHIEGAPPIDEVDRIAGGKPTHFGGLISHSVMGGSERTHLVWEFASLPEVRAALTALHEVRGIDDPHVAPTDANRVMNPGAFEIRRSEVHAGKAICPDCRARIPDYEDTFFALQGTYPGDEVVLRCERCGLPMTWLILAEE
jgi:hypothetical protein